MPDTQHYTIATFAIDGGAPRPRVQVAYQLHGSLAPGRKIVLVSTCFGEKVGPIISRFLSSRPWLIHHCKLAGSNPLIGVGKSLDPQKCFIVRVGLFGGSDVRTSPLYSKLRPLTQY